MSNSSFVPLPGSERAPLLAAEPAGTLSGTERIEVTLVTRRMASLPRTTGGTPARVSRDNLRQQFGSDPADQALVADVLTAAGTGIEVTSRDPGGRRMTIAGPISALSQLFGATLRQVSSPGPGGGTVRHRYREGSLQIPAALDGIILAVLGLDDRPQARAHFRFRADDRQAADGHAAARANVSYPPPQVAAAYQFPAGTDGTGQNLAIIELGGGFSSTELDTYFTGLGITPPSVTAVGVAGGKNVAGQDPSGVDGEVLLDIEVAGSVAPGAAQVVYFAPNTDQGFVDAVTSAVHATPVPTAVSISWGASEDSWTAQARTSLDEAMADAVALGVTVCVASGDNGSTDGVKGTAAHVDFPASSPHALACGGTSLRIGAAGDISSESVWNDGSGGGAGGGGISDVYGLPAWQATAGVGQKAGGTAGRGVPDVAGDADPETGYQVLVDGQSMVVGGTSAVAPLWAALTCRLAQSAGHSFGLMQELLYAGVTPGQPADGLQDITTGNNGAYAAGPGWDACTGLGTPNGTALLARLAAPAVTPAVP